MANTVAAPEKEISSAICVCNISLINAHAEKKTSNYSFMNLGTSTNLLYKCTVYTRDGLYVYVGKWLTHLRIVNANMSPVSRESIRDIHLWLIFYGD